MTMHEHASRAPTVASRPAWEQSYQALRRWRDLLVRPFAALLSTFRVPAGAVSCAGVAFAATTLWSLGHSPRLALLGVLAPLACDALDGAVARHAGTASGGGKILDHLCDSAVFAVLLIATAVHGLAAPALIVLAAYSSLLVVVLGLARRALEVGPSWLANPQAGFGGHFPKSFFLAALITLLLGGPNWIDLSLIACSLTATLTSLFLFLSLLRRWPGAASGDRP